MCPQERAAETSADPLDAFLVSGATALVQGWEAEQRGETRHRGRIRSRSTARIGVGAVPGSAGRFNRTFQPSTARLDRPTGVSACEASAGCTLEPTVRAARQAREFVESALCRAHAGRALGAVKLAASEFATQGVLLGSGPARLHLACHVSHVEVTATYSVPAPVDLDPTTARPALGMFDDLSARIIDSISRLSGSGPADEGWRLWCQIPTGYVRTPGLGAEAN